MPKAHAVRAVLVDLDGTLLDTVDDIAAAGNAMLADAGRAPVSRELVAAYVGQGAGRFVARALAGSLDGDADPALVDRWLPVFLQHYAEYNGRFAQVYPGVREGLAAMVQAGWRLAVVTNKPRELTLDLLSRFDLSKPFNEVVAGGDTERKKPDAQPLLRACELLGTSPAHAVMIGDSVNDVSAARAAGCRALVVPYGYNEGRPVHTLAGDGIVVTLLHAVDVIRGFSFLDAHA